MEEKVLYSGRTHPKMLFRAVLVQIFLLLLHLVVLKYLPADLLGSWTTPIVHGLILLLEVWYVFIPVLRWWNTHFTLTNKRVKNEWGILYKQSREIDLGRIASISEERGILDRIFGCGTLNFYDAAAGAQPRTTGAWNKQQGDNGVRFYDIPRVKEVRAMIEQAKYSSPPA